MKKSNIKLPALVVSKRLPSHFTEGGFYWYVWMKASFERLLGRFRQ